MMSPSPPPPAIAAIVAVAITKTAAIRIPAKISGSASGSSTRQRICAPASCPSRAPPRRCFGRPRRRRSRRSSGSAGRRGRRARPRCSRSRSRGSAIPKAIRTRLGSARPTFETLIARNEPRWRWPRTTPSGSAITSAIPSAAPESAEVLERSCARAGRGLSPMKRNASGNVPQLKRVGEDHARLQA